jgi:hypothetical protein
LTGYNKYVVFYELVYRLDTFNGWNHANNTIWDENYDIENSFLFEFKMTQYPVQHLKYITVNDQLYLIV